MKNKSLKLAEIIRDYPYFEENQVLTDDQLNTVVGYLDQQNRLTRRNLHGYGTVCGLEVAFSNNIIHISKGCGLTTDGDLLELSKKTSYNSFREFKDENAKYKFFEGITVYELFSEDDKIPKDARKLSTFKKHTEQRLEDQVLLLYLESYYFDPDICTGGDCDNKGQNQVNRLRSILVPKEYIEKRGAVFSPAKKYFQLEHVYVQRMKLNAGSIDDFDKLASSYLGLIKKAGKQFSEALSEAFKQLQPALVKDFGNINPVKVWIRKLESIISKAQSDKLFSQPVYDLMTDLSLAYNEFVESVYHWEEECLPDIQESPKHLLIGDATASVNDRVDPYRQEFVASPALRKTDDKHSRMVYLFNRIGKLILSFQGPGENELRITPSKINGLLGEKAIPYYYKVSGSFHESWDYDKNVRGRSDEILSYHARNYSDNPAIINAIDYHWDGNDMLRIEGHIGMNFKTALEKVEKMVKEDNLPIRVMPLLIEHDPKSVWIFPKYKYYGMEILHKLYRDELVHNLNDLKKFSLDLNDKVQKADDEELPPVDIESNTLSMKEFSQQQTQMVNQKVDETKSFLASSIVDFDTDSFENKYKDVVNQSAVFNKGIKGVTFSSAFTPLDKTVNSINFSKLKWIRDLVNKREDKVKERGILEEFLKEHPGLEHKGGVPVGGTFIMVFSSSNKKVVADFCLPYMYYDEPVQEVPEGSDVSDDNLVFEWKFNNKLMVYINQNYQLKGQILELDNKVNQFQLDLNAQSTNLSSYQGSINTLIQTLPTYTWAGGLSGLPGDIQFDDASIARNAEVMKEMEGYRDYLVNRKNAGKATEAEVAMIDDMEEVMAGVIEDTLEKTAGKEGDLKVGGGEAKVMEMAVNAFNKIGKDSAKNRIMNKVNNLKGQAENKANLVNTLNLFNM